MHLPIEEETKVVRPLGGRRRGVGEKLGDEVVPLRHHGKRREKPAVPDAALLDARVQRANPGK